MYYKIIERIDNNKLKISPKWNVAGETGDIIEIYGFPEKFDSEITKRFANAHFNRIIKETQFIHLASPSKTENGILTCKVAWKNVNFCWWFESLPNLTFEDGVLIETIQKEKKSFWNSILKFFGFN